MRHETILRREDTAVVVVDVQDRLLPHIANSEETVRNCRILIEGAKILGLPLLLTEQYPKGLGPTTPALLEALGATRKIEKLSFSCAGSEEFRQALSDLNRRQLVLCGIESHVCVIQTALDLLAGGAQVHIAADAISSRRAEHRLLALERLRREGAIITVVESVLFELMEVAGTDEFKAIAKLIR